MSHSNYYNENMKIHTIYLLITGALLLSCNDNFFETSPATQITTQEVFSSEDNIDAFLNGAIRYLMENSTSQDNPGLPTIFLTHEVMGEDAFARDGRYGFRDSYPFRDPFDNTTRRALFFWTLQYTSIDHANNIIDNIEINANSSQRLKHLKGQAFALRAYNYFNLVRQYQFTYAKDPNAKAIPIYIHPTTPNTEPNPLSSVSEVYDLILDDLTNAENLLVGFERSIKNRPNIHVVKGLFARVYQTLGEWELAAEYAKNARTGYPIMTPEQFTEGFNDVSNPEWLWGHPQTQTQNKGGASYLAYIETTPYTTDANGTNLYYGYNSIMPDPWYIQLFEDGDIRKSLFEIATQPSEELYRHFRNKKFRNKYPHHDGHIVLMRSAELVLIEAESKARLNNLTGAIEVLNELRRKRNLTDLSASDFNKESILEEILLERRRELWGEGFRLYDILRLQIAPERKETTETFVDDESKTVGIRGHWFTSFPDGSPFVPNSKYYLFPIPLNEINNNPNL
jgi:hypothetical protein